MRKAKALVTQLTMSGSLHGRNLSRSLDNLYYALENVYLLGRLSKTSFPIEVFCLYQRYSQTSGLNPAERKNLYHVSKDVVSDFQRFFRCFSTNPATVLNYLAITDGTTLGEFLNAEI